MSPTAARHEASRRTKEERDERRAVAAANECCQGPQAVPPNELTSWWETSVLTPVRSATSSMFPGSSRPPPGYDAEVGEGVVVAAQARAAPDAAALPPRQPSRRREPGPARTLEPELQQQAVQRRSGASGRSGTRRRQKGDTLSGADAAPSAPAAASGRVTPTSFSAGHVAAVCSRLEPTVGAATVYEQAEVILEAPLASRMERRTSVNQWTHQEQLTASLLAWNRRFQGVKAGGELDQVTAAQLDKVTSGEVKKFVPKGIVLAMGAMALAKRLKELQAKERPTMAEKQELLALLQQDAALKNHLFVFMTVLKIAILSYAGMMGSMLVVFVPQTCGVATPGRDVPPGETRRACLFLENVSQFGPYTKFVFVLNLLTLFVFLGTVVVQFAREKFLHEHLDHNQDLPARALPVLMSERPYLRQLLLKKNHTAKIASHLTLGLFVVNFIFSAVLLLGYTNQGVRTLSSLVNNSLLIFIRLVVQASITSQSAGNGWAITLFSTGAVNMNDIDPNFVGNFDDEKPEPPDSELVRKLRDWGLLPERSDKVHNLDEDTEIRDPSCMWCPI